jgi:hypothetical protein
MTSLGGLFSILNKMKAFNNTTEIRPVMDYKEKVQELQSKYNNVNTAINNLVVQKHQLEGAISALSDIDKECKCKDNKKDDK